MSGVNKIILVGNLGADPEVRYTQNGKAVANLRIATNEVWYDKDGQKQERTEWHSVTVWDKQGESCGQYLTKGRQVYVEGRMQSREYTDKDGIERRVWDVVAERVVFLAGGDGRGRRDDSPDDGRQQGEGGRSGGQGGQGGRSGGQGGRSGGQGGRQQDGGGWGGGGGRGGGPGG